MGGQMLIGRPQLHSCSAVTSSRILGDLWHTWCRLASSNTTYYKVKYSYISREYRTVYSTPAGVPQRILTSLRERCKISLHLRRIPVIAITMQVILYCTQLCNTTSINHFYELHWSCFNRTPFKIFLLLSGGESSRQRNIVERQTCYTKQNWQCYIEGHLI